jgi:hypothetical protein
MADTGKQSPLGINVIGSYLLNQGLLINPVTASYMGESKTNDTYTFGSCITDTCLNVLTYAINDGYLRGPGDSNATLSDTTYNNLISIGSTSLGALGNSKPPTYQAIDPSGNWTDNAVAYGARLGITRDGTNPPYPGPATSGYGNYDASALAGYSDPLQGNGVINQEQNATWIPYNTTNPNMSVTQWGWIRCHALQAWNEFNWNGDEVDATTVSYKEFCSSLLSSASFLAYTNQVIMAAHNSQTFLDGSFSNMDDLISADIMGVSLATREFGEDLENLGKLIELSMLDALGLPSLLLSTLGKNNGIVQDLVLALLASGLDSSEITGLTTGAILSPSDDQEKKIYSAFLIIRGENLQEVLAPTQIRTQGLETLADLLDVRKLFPNSYQSLTVPKYNSDLGLPTNSKTYYPIYIDDGVNPALSTPEMQEYVGVQIPNGPPPILETAVSIDNVSMPEKGFGSYLYGIIPQEQAIAIGALAFSLRQVRKIEQISFDRFSKAVRSLESTIGLPLTAGTSKPTDQSMIDNIVQFQALGSGPYGTYTMSDLFGCMSGLPYPWENLYDRILELETDALQSIYDDLFLAVTWEAPQISVIYDTYVVNEGTEEDPIFVTYYSVTGVDVDASGGGYGRGNAPEPIITISNGGEAVGVFGTDSSTAGSNGEGPYGRLLVAILTDPGPDGTSIPTATIEYPPLVPGTNSVTGSVGWPAPMNTQVQNYIDLANAEIALIAQNNPEQAQLLDVYWKGMGEQLMVEQRTRYNALVPVTIPKDPFTNPYPQSINIFVDSLPELAQDTKPHMSAQTIEAISDFSDVGGQSTVGMMRQERNQRRLQNAGITLDNSVPVDMSSSDIKTLTTNGTIPAGIANNIPSPLINIIREETPEILDEVEGYTNPAWFAVEVANQVVKPAPKGIYIPTDSALIGSYIPSQSDKRGDLTPILRGVPIPSVMATVPASLSSAISGVPTVGLDSTVTTGTLIERPVDGFEGISQPSSDGGFEGLGAGTTVFGAGGGAGSSSTGANPSQIVIVQTPFQLDPANVGDNLNIDYTGGVLSPSTYNVTEAIEKVVECNCDCWL